VAGFLTSCQADFDKTLVALQQDLQLCAATQDGPRAISVALPAGDPPDDTNQIIRNKCACRND
jgi:hypothetical protein